MPHRDEEQWIGPFIAALHRARDADDRATLAKLRRGLTDHSAERDLWVFSHLRGAGPSHEEAALLIASLFATHPAAGGRGSLGAAMRRLRSETNSESLDKRFANLLDSHADDISDRLRQAISLLRANSVPVDWAQLLKDTIDWDHMARPVQRRWARDYWAGRATDNEAAPADMPQGATSKTE